MAASICWAADPGGWISDVAPLCRGAATDGLAVNYAETRIFPINLSLRNIANACLTMHERYAICPVIEDPTDGGIATDQFLALPLKANGKPVEPEFLTNFESLRLTGDWAD